MNNPPNAAPPSSKNRHHHSLHRRRRWRSPIPPPAVCILLALLFLGLCFSTFLLIVVHNGFFLILLLCISALAAAFLLWNSRDAAVYYFLREFPDSDVTLAAAHGHLVKITGAVSCGNVSLESSYEKVSPCVYTSTMLYEYKDICSNPSSIRDFCFWRLAYSERQSTDFYITDRKSGVRALVKAGPDSKLIPLINESRLINTSKRSKLLSSDFRNWLSERNVPAEARSLCLQEGYVKEGSIVSVVGILLKEDGVVMVAEPNEVVSTGCLWSKLLLPMDVDGLIIGFPETDSETNLKSRNTSNL